VIFFCFGFFFLLLVSLTFLGFFFFFFFPTDGDDPTVFLVTLLGSVPGFVTREMAEVFDPDSIVKIEAGGTKLLPLLLEISAITCFTIDWTRRFSLELSFDGDDVLSPSNENDESNCAMVVDEFCTEVF